MKIKWLFHNISSIFLWIFFFAFLIYWMSVCVACITISIGTPEVIKENPASSINPKCQIYFRCHKTQSNKDFEDYMRRIVNGYEKQEIKISEPVFIKHKYDGINWLMGDYWGAIIYFEEKEK